MSGFKGSLKEFNERGHCKLIWTSLPVDGQPDPQSKPAGKGERRLRDSQLLSHGSPCHSL